VGWNEPVDCQRELIARTVAIVTSDGAVRESGREMLQE
jgi:hypothetical protein